MIAIGIILIILVFFILSGVVSINENLKVLIKNQIEIIKSIKNK